MGLTADKLDKFRLALKNLEEAVAEPIKTNRDRAGVIQTFEFTYEMSWKLLRDILMQLGLEPPNTPRGVLQEAFSAKLISDEEAWLSMISNRNLTSHTYDQDTAIKVVSLIIKTYLPCFRSLDETAKKY